MTLTHAPAVAWLSRWARRLALSAQGPPARALSRVHFEDPYAEERWRFLDRVLTPAARDDAPASPWQLRWRFHTRRVHRWSLLIRTTIGHRFLIGAEWWRDEDDDARLILGAGWLAIEIDVLRWYTRRELRLITAARLTERARCRCDAAGPGDQA